MGRKAKPTAQSGGAQKKPKAHEVSISALTERTSAVVTQAIGTRNAKEAALHTMTDSAASTTELRESLASLYALAADSCFHSAKCRPQKVGKVIPKFPVSKVVTKSEMVSTEQLWGQLNVVFTPVLKVLQGALEADGESVNAAIASNKRSAADFEDEEDDEDEEEEDDDLLATLAGDNGDDEDADITFGENDGPKQPKKSKKEVSEKDKWKYAFGVDNDAFDDDEEEEDDDEYGESRADRRRNALSEGFDGEGNDAAEDEEANDGNEDFDPYGELPEGDVEEGEDDEAAMKEMYGDDAEYDDEDMPFGGDDENEDDMDDLELLAEDGNAEEAARRQRRNPNHEDEEGYGGAYDEEEEEDGDVLDGDAYNFDDDGKALDALSRRKKVQFDENGEPRDPTATGPSEIDESELEGLSSYQRSALKRQRSIQDLEESRLFGKDWTMMGEAAGKDRGRDVLLDEKLEFDHAMRQVPVITEQVTGRLESRIKKRIMDNHYDDVERRQTKTVASDLTTSKRDEGIDATKSKHSLMDLYEKDYLEKQKKADDAASSAAGGSGGASNAEPLTEVEKDELKAIAQWKRLGQHLDALSNFFYTPKPVQEEVTARVRAIENHAPAIALEAVGVLGVQSKESAIAPQDLFRAHKDKFVGVSKAEMDPMEKQALRRAKKNAGKEKKERMELAKVAKTTTKRRDGEKEKIREEEED